MSRFNPLAPVAPTATLIPTAEGCAVIIAPAPAASTPTPPALDLSGFKKKKEAGKATSEYPVFPDPNGKATYFRLRDFSAAIDDELFTAKAK